MLQGMQPAHREGPGWLLIPREVSRQKGRGEVNKALGSRLVVELSPRTPLTAVVLEVAEFRADFGQAAKVGSCQKLQSHTALKPSTTDWLRACGTA